MNSDPSWLDQGSTSEHLRLLGPLDFDQLEACGCCVDHGRELNSSFKFVAARMAGQNMSPFVSLASALIFLDRSKQMQGRKCVRDNPPYVPKLLRLLCSLHDISVFGSPLKFPLPNSWGHLRLQTVFFVEFDFEMVGQDQGVS